GLLHWREDVLVEEPSSERPAVTEIKRSLQGSCGGWSAIRVRQYLVRALSPLSLFLIYIVLGLLGVQGSMFVYKPLKANGASCRSLLDLIFQRSSLLYNKPANGGVAN
ncbi:hypothetical protein U9M48_042144, partial [Paspalum notatum var. saurae]